MKKRKEYTQPVFIGQNLYIKPSYVVSIPEFYKEGGDHRSADFMANIANLEENEHGGTLSKKAITGLRNSINWLCLAAKKKRVYLKQTQPSQVGNDYTSTGKYLGNPKTEGNKSFFFKVNFITLTLPDTEKPISDRDLQKQLLNPFLTYMRKYHNLTNYVWRLEFQANGKLHVHISTDTFIHYEKIRDTWNRLLDKNGYMDLFYKKHGHRDPNSTDVHATKKIKNMAAYLAKYMSKKGSTYEWLPSKYSKNIENSLMAGIPESGLKLLQDKKNKSLNKKVKPLGVMSWKAWYFQRVNFWNSPLNPRPITGRIWSCSKELSAANKLVVHIPSDECSKELKCLMQNNIDYKEITVNPPKTIHSQFAPDDWSNKPRKIGEVYFLTATDWYSKITGKIREAFDNTRSLISQSSEQTHVFEAT